MIISFYQWEPRGSERGGLPEISKPGGGRVSSTSDYFSALPPKQEAGGPPETHICRVRCSPGGVCGPSWCPPGCTWWQRSGRKSQRSCCHCCTPVGKAQSTSLPLPKPFAGPATLTCFRDGGTGGPARSVMCPRSQSEPRVGLLQKPSLWLPGQSAAHAEPLFASEQRPHLSQG